MTHICTYSPLHQTGASFSQFNNNKEYITDNCFVNHVVLDISVYYTERFRHVLVSIHLVMYENQLSDSQKLQWIMQKIYKNERVHTGGMFSPLPIGVGADKYP